MSCIDDVFEALKFDLDVHLPRVQAKFRDELCFKGKKVDYEDFAKFVRRDGVFVPVWATDGVLEDEMVLDMFPFISVGVAELISFASGGNNNLNIEFWREILTETPFISIEDATLFAEKVKYGDIIENEMNLCIRDAIRSSYINCNQEAIRRIVSALTVLELKDKKRYCKVVLESMRYAYFMAPIFVHEDSSKCVCVNNSGAKREDLFSEDSYRTGAIKYSAPNKNKEHIVSDGRGIGIYSYLVLLFAVYGKYGEALSDKTYILCKDEGYAYVQKCLSGCIGDDYVGRYLARGTDKMRFFDEEWLGVYGKYMRAPFDCYEVYTLDNGMKISRQMYDDVLMWNRANKTEFPHLVNISQFGNYDTNYTSIDQICESVMQFIVSNDAFRLNAVSLLSTLARVHEKSKNMHSSAEGAYKDKNEIAGLREQLASQAESYETRIKDLEYQLELKTNNITKLTEEVASLNEEIESYYSDCEEVIEEQREEGVSVEDIVSFLNDYKVCFIGGRENLGEKLSEIGMNNFLSFRNERQLVDAKPECDFICINTKFVSHHIIFAVKSVYKDKLGQLYYYNGVNVEELLRSSYSFITKWLVGKEI